MVPRWLGAPRCRAARFIAVAAMITAVILCRRDRSQERPPPPTPRPQPEDLPTPDQPGYQPRPLPLASKRRQRRVYLIQIAILASLLGAVIAFSLLQLPTVTPPPDLNPVISNISVVAAKSGVVAGEVYWVGPAPAWWNSGSPERSLELFIPLSTSYYNRPVPFSVVLESDIPLQVTVNNSAARSVNDLYRHSVVRYGNGTVETTINQTGWAVQSITNYDWAGVKFTMITGWVNKTNNTGFTGSNTQLAVGEEGIDFLQEVPQFTVTWKGGDPIYATNGPFLKIAMPDNAFDNTGPAAPRNQPLTASAKSLSDQLLHGPLPSWRSYDTGVGALGGVSDVFSTSWLGNYTPIGNDLPTVTPGVWRFITNAMGRNGTVDTANSYRLFAIGISLGVGGALLVALIQIIFAFWQAEVDSRRKNTKEVFR